MELFLQNFPWLLSPLAVSVWASLQEEFNRGSFHCELGLESEAPTFFQQDQ